MLLSNERAPEENRKVLLEDYGIETTGSMEREMSDMCNLSQGIEDRGITLGKEKQAKDSAIQMYQDNVPVEKIALYTGYAVETIKEWIAQ